MNKIFITAAVLVVSSAAAYANTITVGAVSGNLYQQTVQSPCIFSNPSCTNGGFAATALPTGGAVTGYDSFSPVYSGSTIFSIIGAGNSITLGLDINQASGQPAQTLSAFYMLKNGSVVDSFLFGGTGNVPAGNNGNGYADFLLENFSSFLATDTIQFHFVFNDANDGTENVFLIGAPGTPTPTPEPASLAMLGSGLLIIAAKFRKKAKI
jgi:PEP-CTERM motif-containing protein